MMPLLAWTRPWPLTSPLDYPLQNTSLDITTTEAMQLSLAARLTYCSTVILGLLWVGRDGGRTDDEPGRSAVLRTFELSRCPDGEFDRNIRDRHARTRRVSWFRCFLRIDDLGRSCGWILVDRFRTLCRPRRWIRLFEPGRRTFAWHEQLRRRLGRRWTALRHGSRR